MALVARSDANEITWGEHVFRFEGGTRQVTQAEADILRRYVDQGGPAKVEIVNEKAKSTKGGK